MRKRYITSHRKLSILILLLVISQAFSEQDDTDIVCFAAQNKWICAPEEQKDIANQKAIKLIKDKSSETNTSDVVIKTINIPKFQEPPASKPIIIKNNTLDKETQIKKTTNINPYANLWSHQLIGLSSPQSAINYIHKMKLSTEDVLIIKSTRNDMDWWIVLFGLYKDKETGLANGLNLPSHIEKPWLRPLKNLQVKGFIDKF